MSYLAMMVLTLGCGTDTNEESQTDVISDVGLTFTDFVNVVDSPVGDFTNFEGGYVDEWLTQQVDPDAQMEIVLVGQTTDFETGDPVSEATVEVFGSNEIIGSADQALESDADGKVEGMMMTCTPFAYRVSTDPDLGDTKVTMQINEILDPDSIDPVVFDSVSSATYQVMPSLLGVSPDDEDGIVAGGAYDVNGDPVEGAQIIIVNDEGAVPDGLVVKYFRDEFPNRDQEWTSADGLWVAIDVPPGEWNIEMYVADGGDGHVLMGSTSVSVVADSINISSVFTGYGDGIRLPESCKIDE